MQKTIKITFRGFLTGLLLLAVFSSCNQDDANLISEEILEETAFAENVFAQLSTDVEDAIPSVGTSLGRHGFSVFGFGFGKCMTRTAESPEDAKYPKIITIEYDGDCASDKEVVKSGKIIVTLTGSHREVGSERIVTFEDFYVNDVKIEGTKTITYNGIGQFTSELENGSILTRDGKYILRESTKTKELIEGGDTEERSDDVYQVTGSATGETSDGRSYTKEIVEPLIISKDCFWITQGVVETTINGVTTSVDFGDGTCDNVAIRTNENGDKEEFEMEMKIRKCKKHKHQKKNGKE